MDKPHQPTSDIAVLPAHFPIPGMGFLPVNAFVIKAQEPVLVDTGMGIDEAEFMKALESIIDPPDLKWVWITHDDADHTGNIQKVLEAAPGARLAAHSLAVLRMSTAWPVALHQTYWINSGDSITVGDRKLTAIRPPLFDNPTTIGVYDSKSEAYFCADFCGALIPSPVEDADDLAEKDLAQGVLGWAGADSPWAHMVEPARFGQALDTIRQIAPKMICSAHLPLARGKTEQLLELLAAIPTSTPFVAPNQMVLEQILAQMSSAGT
jgi:flavorubredoxin